MRGRLFIALLGVCAGLCGAVQAQTFPDRAIQLIVPFSPGTSPDIVARGLAERLTESLGQPVLTVDREGASGSIGYATVAAAAPDGYTLAFGPQGPLTVLPTARAHSSYTLDSFAPVCQVFEDIFALFVGPNSTIANFNDLVSKAKARPLSLTFGSPGIATVPHLQVESLQLAAGVRMNHAPYRSVAQMIQDVVGGNVDLAVGSVASMRTSNARILAILKSTPSNLFPDAPVIGQFGYTVSQTSLGGLFAPAATPADVRARLEKGCADAFANPAFQRLESDAGISPVYLNASEFGKRLASDRQDKAALIKTLGITLE